MKFNEELSSFFNVACLRALLKKSYTPISHLPMDVIVLLSHACVFTYTVFYCPVFLVNFILRFSIFDFSYFCISDMWGRYALSRGLMILFVLFCTLLRYIYPDDWG